MTALQSTFEEFLLIPKKLALGKKIENQSLLKELELLLAQQSEETSISKAKIEEILKKYIQETTNVEDAGGGGGQATLRWLHIASRCH